MTDAPKIMTRAEAKTAGLKRYFTGAPCKRGHVAERLVSNGGCFVCHTDGAGRLAATARWRVANRDEVKAYNAKYNAENKEVLKEKRAVYDAAHRKKRRAACKAWREATPEYQKERLAAWQAANPERVRAHTRNRSALKRNAEGRHTAEDIQRIYKAQGGRCVCCKTKVGDKYHVDHIQPLSKGGSNWPANLQILCGPCNIRKLDKDPIEHMQSLGFLL
jgi:5-methylcytosine-specific restriction endonuclease McrA